MSFITADAVVIHRYVARASLKIATHRRAERTRYTLSVFVCSACTYCVQQSTSTYPNKLAASSSFHGSSIIKSSR